jgi:hypothetical protein
MPDKHRSIATLALFIALAGACGDSGGGGTTGSESSTGSVVTTGAATTTDAGTSSTSSGTSDGSSDTSATDPSTGPQPTTGDNNPFDDPPQCSSREYWEEEDDEGSERMNPGEACISCHTNEDDAPTFLLAGTVYPTAHEPNDCNSVAPATDAEVVITDAMNQVFVLEVNAVGNFFLEDEDATLVPPFTAKVVLGGEERQMFTPQTIGDCNSCHTQDGANGAPGRILAP